MKKYIILVFLLSFFNSKAQLDLRSGVNGIKAGISSAKEVINLYGEPSKVEISETFDMGGEKFGGSKNLIYDKQGVTFLIHAEHINDKNPIINEILFKEPFSLKSSEQIYIGMSEEIAKSIMKEKYFLVKDYESLVSYSVQRNLNPSIILMFENKKLKILSITDEFIYSNKTNDLKDTNEISFEGTGISNTKPFEVGDRWNVNWNFVGDSFTIYLFNLKGDVQYYVLATQSGSGSGSSFYPDAGEYYLKVNSNGKWNIQISE